MPTIFEEAQLRVFVRDARKQGAAQKAFRRWAHAQKIPEANHDQEFGVFSPEPPNGSVMHHNNNNSRYNSNTSIFSQEPIFERRNTQDTIVYDDKEDEEDDYGYDLHRRSQAFSTPTQPKRFHRISVDLNNSGHVDEGAVEDGLSGPAGDGDRQSHESSQMLVLQPGLERQLPSTLPAVGGEPSSESSCSSQLFHSIPQVHSSQFPATLQRVDHPSAPSSEPYNKNRTNVFNSHSNSSTPVFGASRYQQRIAAAVSVSGISSPPQQIQQSPRTPSHNPVGPASLLSPAYVLVDYVS